MPEPIFSAFAHYYWAKGLPVIPLKVREKRPFDFGWQRFAEKMPTEAEKQAWLREYQINNIGLPLGPQSELAVFDIDTDDQRVLKAVEELVPASPWKRVGKKGYVIVVKYNPDIPTFRIKDYGGRTLVEYLSKGTQVVLPPSIHPDTGKPYQSNTNLWEVLDDVPVINTETEALLRGRLKEDGVQLSHSGSSKIIEWVPKGARDVKMIEQAGLYAYAVTRGERSLLEGLGMLAAWNEGFVEHVAGDDIDIDKGKQRLIQFLCRDVQQGRKILPQGWDEGLTEEDKKELGLTFTDDDVEWSKEQILEYLKNEFEKYDRKSPMREQAVEYALAKIAKARNLSVLGKESLLRYILDVSAMNISMAALRKRVRELEQGPIEGLNHTEIAMAVREDVERVSPLKFAGGKFRKWNGSHWESLEKSQIYNIIADKYGSLIAAKKASDHSGIVKVLEHQCAADLSEIPVNGVNFANGVLLEDGTLVDHNPDYGMTYTLPFRYLPHEAHKCEKFKIFLQRSWGRDPDYGDKVKALQEAICATVFGLGPKFQRAVLLLGPPKTGKSQLLDIVQSLVPDNARCAVPPDQWNDKFSPARMYGKLLNYCGELSELKSIAGEKFKEIICGEEITGQFKGQQLFEFRPACMHWFASNHAPRTRDTSGGFSRRWLVLKFGHPVTNKEKVLNLGEEIVMSEREAIMAWALEARERLMDQRGYTIPTSHEDEIHDMAIANNSVRYFFEESGKVVVASPDSKDGLKPSSLISEKDIYHAYSFFCGVEAAAKPVMRPRFREIMKELASQYQFELIKYQGKKGEKIQGYLGLTLVDAKAEQW